MLDCRSRLTVSLAIGFVGVYSVSVEASDETVDDTNSPALTEFLRRFDPVSNRGFVKTLRPGSTGIGFTLETLLKIRENNSPKGDLLGMEIKAYRDNEIEFDDHSKMNLFLKEPTWQDGRTSADRIRDYGYVDPNGRQAWYQSVTSRPNTAGLLMQVDRGRRVVLLQRKGVTIGHWLFETLQKRLIEKLSEVVFVAAATRGAGRDEEFHYRTVTYCCEPSNAVLVELIESGDVILELRMHLKPTGGARNHGTAFRIRKHRLKELFETRRRVRFDASKSPS